MNRETKTTVPPAGGPDSPERRRFLTGLCLGLSALASAVVSIPVLGFVLAPLLRKEERAWRRVGSVEAFKVGATVAVTFPKALASGPTYFVIPTSRFQCSFNESSQS